MAKGSQLTQLKSALSQAGISKQPQNGKKRKRAQNEEKDREKRAARLQEIHQKLNPFDVKVTKLKHDVGGRKLKGVTGRPAQSKQAGIEQRKKTLLKEYEVKGHAGGILDRRFGENDPTMTPEERMLERFTRERQRAAKGVSFNLEDDEELTHYGQSLSKLDDFDHAGFGLDDDEEDERGQIDSEVVRRTHFGGFGEDEGEEDDEEGPARKKTKAEVMAEVMAKSKEYKLQRQMDKERDENIRHQLDQELDSIRSLLTAPDPISAALEQPDAPGASKLSAAAEDRYKEYDAFVRELAFERRAKPKDRTKTEEELALEEKERLEKAERKRIRRMNGEEDVDSDDEAAAPRKRKRDMDADDLDDDFYAADGWNGIGEGLQEEGRSDNDEDGARVSGEESNEEDESDEEGEEGEGENESGSEVSETEMAEGSENESAELVTAKARKKKPAAVKKELPFTFPCPETHDEFLDIVEDVEDDDVPVVVQRIRALYHPSLGEDNKYKLQRLTGVLIDHILYITSPPNPRFSLLTSLIPHLFSLTKTYPIQSAQHFVAKLTLMQKNLRRGLSQGANELGSRTWPGLPELTLLRVVGIVWPTSDMNHVVVSPARLLMGSYLGLCRVRSVKDIASGLFLCTLFLQYEELSKRFVPEALNFAINALLHLAPHSYQDSHSLPGSLFSPDFGTKLRLSGKKAKKLSAQKANLSELLNADDDNEQAKVDLLGVALDLVGRFADMYKGLEGFIELFEPILEVVEHVKTGSLPTDLQDKLSKLKDSTERLLKFSRQARRPLHLQAHKPIPIPTFIPKFESSSSSYLRARDPDHERNEAAKLRRQYKQERKGAIRELRKDSRFLAGVEQEKQREKDAAYAKSMKRVYGSIEGERAEEKAMQREKAREKRRAGKK
ncbi:Nop14-like protein [Dentipellis sp. KUC8613]|nr:Nop14-like protein [Dentipellis sp. KUC8613]